MLDCKVTKVSFPFSISASTSSASEWHGFATPGRVAVYLVVPALRRVSVAYVSILGNKVEFISVGSRQAENGKQYARMLVLVSVSYECLIVSRAILQTGTSTVVKGGEKVAFSIPSGTPT